MQIVTVCAAQPQAGRWYRLAATQVLMSTISAWLSLLAELIVHFAIVPAPNPA